MLAACPLTLVWPSLTGRLYVDETWCSSSTAFPWLSRSSSNSEPRTWNPSLIRQTPTLHVFGQSLVLQFPYLDSEFLQLNWRHPIQSYKMGDAPGCDLLMKSASFFGRNPDRSFRKTSPYSQLPEVDPSPVSPHPLG